MNSKQKKGIILLSSGLDSLVSLYVSKEMCDIVLALTFDYGQKAAGDEIFHAKKITEKFNIEHKIIELPFLKEVTDNALTNPDKSLEFDELGLKSARAVWVPNRNGVFLNIAAMYADSVQADYIIYGANAEEAATFPDNSRAFNEAADRFFSFSTLKKPVILAPLAKMEKYEIINKGLNMGVDFSLLKSCYDSSNKTHCGRCESCKRLKAAILKSKNKDLINLIF
ncbi:MAG: 7-cyano-7-deazaguanine synthase QueC [Candidatus Gastranaerophilales bacterium]|nr:7-cyano-7-deazaguanine synthase QueC [Candidatus Gastranaerophilales bacterium]